MNPLQTRLSLLAPLTRDEKLEIIERHRQSLTLYLAGTRRHAERLKARIATESSDSPTIERRWARDLKECERLIASWEQGLRDADVEEAKLGKIPSRSYYPEPEIVRSGNNIKWEGLALPLDRTTQK